MAESSSFPRTTGRQFIDLLGIEMLSVEEGKSVCRLKVEERHGNLRGYLHGGVTFSLIDTGMGAAVWPLLKEGEGCTTIEIKISYITSVKSGVLVCTSTVLRKGRRVAFIESDVRLEDRPDELVARATGTYAITALGRRGDERRG